MIMMMVTIITKTTTITDGQKSPMARMAAVKIVLTPAQQHSFSWQLPVINSTGVPGIAARHIVGHVTIHCSHLEVHCSVHVFADQDWAGDMMQVPVMSCSCTQHVAGLRCWPEPSSACQVCLPSAKDETC